MINSNQSPNLNQEENKKHFKGIWIPKDIWENRALSPNEKFLLAEIDSLDDGKLGCYASNKYLANFLQIQIRGLQKILERLKAQNLIKTLDIQGKRYIQSLLTKREEEEVGHGCTSGQGGMSSRTLLNTPPSNIYINKIENINPIIPLKRDVVVEKISFGKYVKLEKKKIDELYEKHTQKIVDEIIEEMNDWIEAKGKSPYKDYAAAIRMWIKRRQNSTNTSNSTPLQSLAINSVKKNLEDKNFKRQKLKELAELICANSNDPCIVDNLKLLDYNFWDGSKGLSIKYSTSLKEIIKTIEENYNKPYIINYVNKLKDLDENKQS